MKVRTWKSYLRSWEKSVGIVLLLVGLVFYFCPPARGAVPQVTASAAILLDASSGTILYAKEPYTRRAPASTTKILTGLLVIEQGNLDDMVIVSRRAGYTEGSTAYLRPGERISLENLLYGALLSSGNDACAAMAEHIAGTEAIFVEMLNQRAKALGAWDSNFRNPHGLPEPGHYTTAYDLALIARCALRNSKFREIVRRKRKVIREEGTDWEHYFDSTNQLLWDYKGADGVKTGTTREAGPCLVASATRGGRQLIAVVLNSGDRWDDSVRLLDHGFDDFILHRLANQGEKVGDVEVAAGMANRVFLTSARDLNIVLPVGAGGELESIIEARKGLTAPIKQGEEVGEIRAVLDGEVIKRVPLLAGVAVQRRTFFRTFLLRIYLPLLRMIKF